MTEKKLSKVIGFCLELTKLKIGGFDSLKKKKSNVNK